MMNKRKWFAICLCASLTVSSLLPVASSFAQEVTQQFLPFISSKPTLEPIGAPNNRMSEPQEITLQTVASDSMEDIAQPIYQGEKDTIVVNPSQQESTGLSRQSSGSSLPTGAEQQDLFNMSQEDMEKYLKEGYSIADLYEADSLANKILVEPYELLQIKIKLGSWEKVKQTAISEKAQQVVEKYKEKYPKVYQQLRKQSLSPEMELLVMSAYDKDTSLSVDSLAKDMKKSPEQFINSQSAKALNSKDSIISGKGVGDLSINEKDIEDLREIAKKRNIPVEILIQKYMDFQKGDE